MNTDALSVHHYIIFHIGFGVIFISKKSSEMRTAEQRACVHQLSHEIRPVLRQASSLNVALGHTRQLMWRSQVISRERDPLVCVASLIDHALPPRSRRQIIWLSLRRTVVRWFPGAYLEPHWHRFRWKIFFCFIVDIVFVDYCWTVFVSLSHRWLGGHLTERISQNLQPIQ